MSSTNRTSGLDLISHVSGAAAPPSPISNVDELAAAFLVGYGPATRQAYRHDLRRWAASLAEQSMQPLDAHRSHVELWSRQMEIDGLAPATVARRLSAIAGFYEYALDEGLITRSPVARVRRPKGGDESPRLGLDRSQMAAFLHAAEEAGSRTHALACLLALSGLRISETLALDVSDLGQERGHRVVHLTRKGGKKQTLAIAPMTAHALADLTDDVDDGPVFRTRTGRRLDRHAAAKIVRRIARAADINGTVSPHSLRHSFVTAALDAGVPLRDVQDAAGHADPRTTRRYDRGRHNLDRAATYAVAAAVLA